MASETSLSLELPTQLANMIPPDLAEAEAVQWRALSASQRKKAMARMGALSIWNDGKGDIDVKAAAGLADTTVSSFYRIAAKWRELPCLASLGIHARPRRRDSTVAIPAELEDRLAAAAFDIALLFDRITVSSHVELMLKRADLDPGTPRPGSMKLREIAEAARRRVQANLPMGQLISFDCCAVSLPRDDRRPHIAFLCMDAGSGIVLGVGVGRIETKISGYAKAASDALATMGRDGDRWRWSNVFSTLRMGAAREDDRIVQAVHSLNVRHRDVQFVIQRDKAPGRMIGQIVGPRLGRARFTPGRTLVGEAMPNNDDMTPWTELEAYDALRRAADERNAQIFDGDRPGATEPPVRLVQALTEISGLHA